MQASGGSPSSWCHTV
ncbi:hypothetical protein LINPERHAP1_LOCUS33574 [Linum perenne]